MKSLLVALVAAAVFAPIAGGTPATTFRLANSSAACTVLAGGSVACRSVSVREAVVLPSRGAPRVISLALTWSRTTPVLSNRRSRRIGTITCSARDAMIACVNTHGATIFVNVRGIAAAL